MKKRFFLVVFIVLIVFITCVHFVYAGAASFPNGGVENSNIKSATEKIWGSVLKIAQILSFMAIIFAGIRYMLASSEGRAEIKKSISILILGAIIVFASSTIVQFVTETANGIL